MTGPDPKTPPAPDGEVLEQLLATWFQRLDDGERPTAAEHCASHPRLLADFVRLLERAGALDTLLAPEAVPASEPPPQRLGDFELIAPLGSGGGGEVWLARQSSLQRLVALKFLRPSTDERNRQRLWREAEVAASLDHPGIVPIYAVGSGAERAWIAMKWLPGPALDCIGSPIEATTAARIAAFAARALHEAHQVGIIHRDIKPSNIVLDGDNPCIVDFGLARDSAELTRTTVDGHVSGTLLYMSPEQLRSGGSMSTLDARTDVYSLGATLYELLTGRPPFEGDHPGKVIHQILEADPPPPPADRDLTTIVLRAMDKDRERRFPSALELAADLERWLAGEPIQSRRTGLAVRAWKLVRRHRRASLLLATAALVALALALSLAWSMRQRHLAFETAVLRVREELGNDRLATAGKLLEPLKATDPGAEVVQRLERELGASSQLERLLDLVQSLPEDSVVSDLQQAIAGIDVAAMPAHRRTELMLALPVAHRIRGDLDAAHAAAEVLPPGRARSALLAMLDSPAGEWDLPPATTAIEHLFTALAMRLAERPLAERREEIALGIADEPTNARIRLQFAIQRANEGAYESAYDTLRGLFREDGRYPRLVHRLMVFTTIRLQRDAEAATLLAGFEAAHPQSDWSAAEAACFIDAWYWLGRKPDELLAAARERWRDDSQIAILSARSLRDSRPEEARELIEHSRQTARTEALRNQYEMELLTFDASRVPPMVVPLQIVPDAPTSGALQGIAQRAEALVAGSRSQGIRVAAATLRARALLADGDLPGAVAVLDGVDEGEPVIELERSQQLVAFLALAMTSRQGNKTPWGTAVIARVREKLGWNLQTQIERARPRLASALARIAPRSSFHGFPARAAGNLIAAQLADAVGDKAAIRTAIDQVRADLGRKADDLRIVQELVERSR
ncbi:MAG: serine/threonine-protein kinase [Planctomycetota bacterium]